jgi:protein-S-isoprenylcysteine O-methyltransferase Ste14
VDPPIFFGNPGANPAVAVTFWVTVYAWLSSEIWLGWRRRAPAGVKQQDRGSQGLVVLGGWVSVALGIGLAFSLPRAAFRDGRTLLVVVGIVLMLVGIALRWYAIALLGRSFTVTVVTQAGQRVMDLGPYRCVRHPSYAGSLLTIVGVLVADANPVSFLGLILALLAYSYRIRIEEAVLSRDLGEPYRAYMRRTRRLIPLVF